MTRINLDSIKINFPTEPNECFEHSGKYAFQDYPVIGTFLKQKIGKIVIEIATKYPEEERCEFWFRYSEKTRIAMPVVIFQETDSRYKGEGINERLLELVNQEAKRRFHEPLVSDTNFIPNNARNWNEDGYAERPGKRVWEKLTENGLAYLAPFEELPRWVMY